LLLELNRALVSVFRYECDALFRDFVRNLDEMGLNDAPGKVLNNLTLLQLLFSEGFDFENALTSAAEQRNLRESIEQNVRSILKYFCLCLRNDGGREGMVRTSHCLKTLLRSIEHIPTKDLFECNLVELLVELTQVP
jgi:hypothetical protein